ncbi:MAG: hypothetical protein EOP06_25945 [Proteobacteria bacterium]|nr:MAG: hypothetical protein EOP06_25945 [Pseudomonadota bacterium]
MISASSSQISIIIQGAPSANLDLTKKLNSLRKLLPDAQVIISTWKHSNLEPVNLFDLIESDDPGYFIAGSGQISNVNRLIVSTREGLNLATRPYALKLRFDTDIDEKILHFCRLDLRPSEGDFSIFKSRLRITNVFTRDAEKTPYLFHPSDMVMFGLTEDLRDYWASPLAAPSDLLSFYEERLDQPIQVWVGPGEFKLVPEQWILLSALSRKLDLGMIISTRHSLSYEAFLISSKSLLHNFELVDHEQSGVVFPQRFIANVESRRTVLDARKFNSLLERSEWGWRVGFVRAVIAKAGVAIKEIFLGKKFLKSNRSRHDLA